MEVQKPKKNKGSIATGLIILAIGVVALLVKMGVDIPSWVWSWKMILIVIGLAIGFENRFSNPSSYVLIAIGGIFIIDDIFNIPINLIEYFWPLLIIFIGITLVVQALRRKSKASNWELVSGTPISKSEESMEVVSIFNGLKREVRSQHFRGGEAFTLFGNTDLNFMPAKLAEPAATVEITVIFGSNKVIVPAHWEVRSEISSIFASVEDKRAHYHNKDESQSQVLILRGTVLFGALEVHSY